MNEGDMYDKKPRKESNGRKNERKYAITMPTMHPYVLQRTKLTAAYVQYGPQA